MATPTPAQIAAVQNNIPKLQALNDYIYKYGQHKVDNAYGLLSPKDQGGSFALTLGLNIIEGAFWAVGSEFGPAGNFMASFLSGMLSAWATDPPPNLGLRQTAALLKDQLSGVFEAVDKQLAMYNSNVAGNWNTTFTYNNQTKSIGDLATMTIPTEADNAFYPLVNAGIFALDQTVWAYLLKEKFVITHWIPHGSSVLAGKQDQPMTTWNEQYLASHPAYYNVFTWHQSSGCGDTTGWDWQEYNLGTGSSTFSDGSLNDAACAYLFKDSADNVIINNAGLYPRKTVFTALGINQVDHYSTPYGMAAPKLSTGYLRAMKEGNTLGQLIQREGREAVQQRVIAKAHQDPIFAADLARRPRMTLEKFLGIRIPDVVALSVTVEDPRTFGLVIPMQQKDASGS